MLCVKTFCIGDNLGGLINIILIKYQRSSLIGKRVSYFLTRFRMNERMKITKIQFGSACSKLSSIFHFPGLSPFVHFTRFNTVFHFIFLFSIKYK